MTVLVKHRYQPNMPEVAAFLASLSILPFAALLSSIYRNPTEF